VNFNDDNEFLVDDGKLVLGREENIVRRFNIELYGGPYTEGDASDYYLAREHKLVRNANLNYRNSGDGGARYDTHRIVMGYSNVYELGSSGYYPTYHALKFQVAPTWEASSDVGEQDTKMIIQGNGNVGIGTTNPLLPFHLYGDQLIQSTYYMNATTDYTWYTIGTWEALRSDNEKGATLHLTLVGGVLYGSGTVGKSEIYARIGNSSAVRTIYFKQEGEQIFSDVRLRRVGTENFKYDVCARMRFYTRNTVKIECGVTEQFERKFQVITEPDTTDTANVTVGINLMTINANGQATFRQQSNNTSIYIPARSGTSTSDYSGMLYGHRPGDLTTNNLGAVWFVNGSDRSTDGGEGNTTFRSDIGALNLGRTGTTTTVYGASHDTFTGQHVCWVDNKNANVEQGMIVSSTSNEYVSLNHGLKRGNEAITINESVPIVSLSEVVNDKCCFGVVSRIEEINTPTRYDDQNSGYTGVSAKERGDNRVIINSLGEGAIWVVNTNGNLNAGDYITTSNVSGYGQRQDSEFMANYTVGKITMDCDFNPSTRVKQIIKQELSNVYLYNNGTSKDKYYEDNFSIDEPLEVETNVYYLHSNTSTTISYDIYNILDPSDQEQYVERHEIIYKRAGKTYEVHQELVNVLDEHGQLQWQDDPSGATEKAYKIRYLDASGAQTDEANAVHIAAFVGCTYHCG
jgi:hypothetical protein